MLRKLLSLALTIGAFTATALAQSRPTNLDFEAGEVGSVPNGWKATSPSGGSNPGYTARLTAENARQGKYCAELGSEGGGRGFGNLMQSFDGAEYRGKRVRFRAAVRAQGQAQLWLRVDRKGGEMGFFDNMGDRPIRDQEWKYYEITADIEPDAELINFGVILLGSGKLWIDDSSFQVLGSTPRLAAEPARPLTARGLQNEVAFARLYGLVRYFHPSDQAARVDWNSFVVRGVQRVESAKDDAALAKMLSALFAPVAPTLRVLHAGEKYSVPDELKPQNSAGLKVTYWRHHGVGLGGPGKIYRSEREQASMGSSDGKSIPSPGTPWVAELGGGIKAWVAMALFVDQQGTMPHVAGIAEAKKEDTPLLSGDDRAVRLADVAIAWNIFEHFYPYFDVTGTDWPAALPKYLQAAASDKNATTFKDTLSRLVAELHDGHGGVYRGGAPASLPLAWDWVQGKLVITAVGSAAEGRVARGDAVTEINGRRVAELLAAKEELISGATPQWIRWNAVQQLAFGEKNQTAVLTIDPFSEPGKFKKFSIKYEAQAEPVEEGRPAKIAEVEAGIFYVDIGRITDADFDAALPKLKAARGIVFDFRGYPSQVSPAFLTHLSDHGMTSAQWHVPVVLWPDRQRMTFERGGEWNLTPAQPLLEAKKAFIIDGRAISYAESCMGIVEAYKLGAIVGGPTAGTNGNVNPFTLPGGYQIAWTGMKVLKHDGSRHHGLGIIPTIPVSRTQNSIAAGHDEFLDRAVASVKE